MTDVYVAGFTVDVDFPGTAGGAQSAFGGITDGFVARLNADLTALDQATFLGGADEDVALALAIAPTTGDVYAACLTASTLFPGTTGGAQGAFGGAQDAFVARLSADLSETPTTTSTTTSTTHTTSTSTSSSPTTIRATITTTTEPPTTTTRPTTSTTTTTTIPDNTCPVGRGFWKNHPSAWPVGTLMLGSQTYTESELLKVLRMRTGQSSGTDASLILARRLIVTKLNIANGSDPTTIGTTVADADRLLAVLGDKLPNGVSRSSVLGQLMVSDGALLDSYNRGRQTPTCVRSSHMRRRRGPRNAPPLRE